MTSYYNWPIINGVQGSQPRKTWVEKTKKFVGTQIPSSWDLNEKNIIILYERRSSQLVLVIPRFVVTFGINNTSDISKLLYVISRTVRRVKFETILKYHEWYLCQISRTNHAIICLSYYPQKVCNFHMSVFQIKLKYHCSKPIKLQKFLM